MVDGGLMRVCSYRGAGPVAPLGRWNAEQWQVCLLPQAMRTANHVTQGQHRHAVLVVQAARPQALREELADM